MIAILTRLPSELVSWTDTTGVVAHMITADENLGVDLLCNLIVAEGNTISEAWRYTMCCYWYLKGKESRPDGVRNARVVVIQRKIRFQFLVSDPKSRGSQLLSFRPR